MKLAPLAAFLPFFSTLAGGVATLRLSHRLHPFMAFASGVLVATAVADLLPEAGPAPSSRSQIRAPYSPSHPRPRTETTEKTSIQARIRRHPTLPPAARRAMRVEHEYERGGALAYLGAWDVHRAKMFATGGRCPRWHRRPAG
ncbi:MAG TPA: hypothetical protein VF494_08765 [Candidatus Limnocylindrales bacterium]